MRNEKTLILGYIYTLSAFIIWAFVPFYWKRIDHVDAFELLGHRIVWGLFLLLIWILMRGRGRELWGCVLRPQKLFWSLVAAFLIGLNWYIFVYAINHSHIVEASLGYFLNPLFSVFLGWLVLQEKLGRKKKLAFLSALIGLIFLMSQDLQTGWIAPALAGSFGLYGLLRKKLKIDADTGLFIEIALLFPAALILLGSRFFDGTLVFLKSEFLLQFLILLTGLVTILPLILFVEGVKRLPLSTVGMLQYLTPTGQLLIGVFAFQESFGDYKAVAFLFIWCGIFLFSWEEWWDHLESKRE